MSSPCVKFHRSICVPSVVLSEPPGGVNFRERLPVLSDLVKRCALSNLDTKIVLDARTVVSDFSEAVPAFKDTKTSFLCLRGLEKSGCSFAITGATYGFFIARVAIALLLLTGTVSSLGTATILGVALSSAVVGAVAGAILFRKIVTNQKECLENSETKLHEFLVQNKDAIQSIIAQNEAECALDLEKVNKTFEDSCWNYLSNHPPSLDVLSVEDQKEFVKCLTKLGEVRKNLAKIKELKELIR